MKPCLGTQGSTFMGLTIFIFRFVNKQRKKQFIQNEAISERRTKLSNISKVVSWELSSENWNHNIQTLFCQSKEELFHFYIPPDDKGTKQKPQNARQYNTTPSGLKDMGYFYHWFCIGQKLKFFRLTAKYTIVHDKRYLKREEIKSPLSNNLCIAVFIHNFIEILNPYILELNSLWNRNYQLKKYYYMEPFKVLTALYLHCKMIS